MNAVNYGEIAKRAVSAMPQKSGLGEIQEQLSHLENAVDSLQKGIDDLGQRLNPVPRPEEPSNKAYPGGEPDSGTCSPVAVSVVVAREGVNRAHSRIVALLGRLAV